MTRSITALLVSLFCSAIALAATVRIENPVGSIDIRVIMGAGGVQIVGSSPARPLRPGDVQSSTTSDEVVIKCQPEDNAPVNIVVTVPHFVRLEAATSAGAISLSGLLPHANLTTDTGNIKIATPWRLMRLVAVSSKPPREVLIPDIPGIGFEHPRGAPGDQGNANITEDWKLVSARQVGYPPTGPLHVDESLRQGTFGEIGIEAKALGRIELTDLPLPADSRVLEPFNAPAVLDGMLQSFRKRAPSGQPRSGAQSVPVGAESEKPAPQGSEFVFSSTVRLVTLSMSVYDRHGHPVPGLSAADFEVIEDGTPQAVAHVMPVEAPFSLVLFLDLSSSTINARNPMMTAALGFLGITRPSDRVAIHALANSLFHIVLPLTHDRNLARSVIGNIPDLKGNTPLYDALVLSCAQESLYNMQDRTALIVLSDGIDNQLQSGEYGSKVPFERLRDAVAEWPILIYPIVVGPGATIAFPKSRYVSLPQDGRRRMQALADASGGRLFGAASLNDLGPVYAQVAEELRTVYSVQYYPHNQDFNGRWRRIQLRLKRPGLVGRTRKGYYAW